MNRATENALLLVLGMVTAMVTLGGAFTRYVRPSLLPWLLAVAAGTIALAVIGRVRDARRDHDDTADAHADDHPRRSVSAG